MIQLPAEPTEPLAPEAIRQVTNSEMRTYKECKRKWWLQYVRRLQQNYTGPGPLSLGNMVHHVLEQFYGFRDPSAAEDYATSGAWRTDLEKHCQERAFELAEAGADSYIVEMQNESALASIMLEGYFEWLQESGIDGVMTITGAEEQLEVFIGNIEGIDVYLRCKLDAPAVLNSTGETLFIDHKTVQNLADLPKMAHLDEQMLTYGLAQRLQQKDNPNARRAIGGMFNMLRKVKRTARANPPFYGRYAVYHNDEEYRAFYLRVWGQVRDMLRLERELFGGADPRVVAYPNPTRDCTWKCPFFHCCQMFDDGSDVESVLAENFHVGDPNARYVEQEKG